MAVVGRGEDRVEQNAYDLVRLFGAFMFIMLLPVAIGLVAVLRGE